MEGHENMLNSKHSVSQHDRILFSFCYYGGNVLPHFTHTDADQFVKYTADIKWRCLPVKPLKGPQLSTQSLKYFDQKWCKTQKLILTATKLCCQSQIVQILFWPFFASWENSNCAYTNLLLLCSTFGYWFTPRFCHNLLLLRVGAS